MVVLVRQTSEAAALLVLPLCILAVNATPKGLDNHPLLCYSGGVQLEDL